MLYSSLYAFALKTALYFHNKAAVMVWLDNSIHPGSLICDIPPDESGIIKFSCSSEHNQ